MMRKWISLLMTPVLFSVPVGAPVTAFAEAPVQEEFALGIKAGDSLMVDAPSGLNVRQRPNAVKIGAIPNGDTVQATGPAVLHRTGRDGEQYWLPVRYQNESNETIEGWIYLRYAGPSETKEQNQQRAAEQRMATLSEFYMSRLKGQGKALTQEPPTSAQSQDGVDQNRNFNLTVKVQTRARFRAGPGLDKRILGRLRNDAKVEIIGKPQGEWVPVRVSGTGQMGWMHVSLLEAEGGLNPLELAESHDESPDEASKRIEEFAKTVPVPVEASVVPACASCQETSLAPLPTGSGNYIFPTSQRKVGSAFGSRRVRGKDRVTGQTLYRDHKGVDFSLPYGSPVVAVRAGKVIKVVSNCSRDDRKCGGGYGNHIEVDHGNGVVSQYAHLSSAQVRTDDVIPQGALIGRIGTSGSVSRNSRTGRLAEHLHFEIRVNGQARNPMNYLGK